MMRTSSTVSSVVALVASGSFVGLFCSSVCDMLLIIFACRDCIFGMVLDSLLRDLGGGPDESAMKASF